MKPGATAEDVVWMAEAVRLAARVPRRPWPNPPVGALVVRDGACVGRGAHHGPGTDHAEVAALAEAGSRAAGATLYCTLEPCNHQGRTPACAPRVAASGIRRLVVGVSDPNPHVAGGGFDVVRAAGIEVVVGVLGAEALELVWPFVATRAFEQPFVVLKMAASLDGRFAPRRAAASGPVYLTGLPARRDVHRARRWADVVLVGRETAMVDRPRLDTRLVEGDAACPLAEPVPACADTRLRAGVVWNGRAHYVLAGCQSALPDDCARIEGAGGRVCACDERDGRVAPESALAALRALGACAILVEGGPTLAASFLEAGLVDRFVTYVAPVVLGDGVGWPAAAAGEGRFHLTRVERCGDDVKLVHDRVSFADTLAQLTIPAWRSA